MASSPRPSAFQRYAREEDEGNCEYKLSLASASEERVCHLVTQLLFRLNEGSGRAVYRIGVSDGGRAVGLCDADLEASLETLRLMADTLGAKIASCDMSAGEVGRVAEVRIEGGSSKHYSSKKRVAVIGAVGAGKSSLVGALATGDRDDGRGHARAFVLRHCHEIEADGQTSDMVELTVKEDPSVALIDLAGSEKYLKTTIFGLTARFPDAALLVVDARDCRRKKLRRMTLEHLGVAVALDLPVIFVLTHADLLKSGLRQAAIDKVSSLYETAISCRLTKRPLRLFVVSNVTGEGYDNLTKALSSLTSQDHHKEATHPSSLVSSEKSEDSSVVSSSSLSKEGEEDDKDSFRTRREDTRRLLTPDNKTLVRIFDAHRLPGVGTVLGGTVDSGTVCTGDLLFFGPLETWRTVRIRSIRLEPNDEAVCRCGPGQSAAFCVGDDAKDFEKISKTSKRPYFKVNADSSRRATGMVLVSGPVPLATFAFTASLLCLRRGFDNDLESVVHAHTVRQSAKIIDLPRKLLAGHKAVCTLKFLFFQEVITPGTTIILRDGRTRAVGTVLSLLPDETLSKTPQTDNITDDTDKGSQANTTRSGDQNDHPVDNVVPTAAAATTKKKVLFLTAAAAAATPPGGDNNKSEEREARPTAVRCTS